MRINLSAFNKWDLGMSAGITFPRTDITGKAKLGIGFDFTRFLSPHFAIQGRFIHATLAGEDINNPNYQYSSTINYDLTINAKLQTSNLIILPENLQRRIALYATIGAGLITYSPGISLDGGHIKLNGIYSQYSQEYDTFDYRGSTDFTMPVAIGGCYRINDRISINAEYSYRITNTDKLDGYFKLLSNNDNWAYFNAGIIIHLGPNGKVLEWHDQRQVLYDEIDSLRKKVDNYNTDSDKDGVADAFDKEPHTPPGTKVYGDGTSVDTDNDGIPDQSDDEPFSSRNAKVDAHGKEIRQQAIKPVETTAVADTFALAKTEFPVIYFDYDKSVIKRENNSLMGEIAQIILSDKAKHYRIVAICDNASNAYNVGLANRRAESVKKHLVKYYNIKENLLKTEVEFVPNNKAMAEKNRRVEVKLAE